MYLTKALQSDTTIIIKIKAVHNPTHALKPI